MYTLIIKKIFLIKESDESLFDYLKFKCLNYFSVITPKMDWV